MVPRHNIFSLSADMPLDEAMAKVVEEQHSRVPVYDPQKGRENIIGLLYSKDLSRMMHMRLSTGMMFGNKPSALKVRHLMREVLFVPESKSAAGVLLEFQSRKRHLAIVVDEFGSVSGLVTVEDVLEQLVGELEDEFDVAQPAVASLSSGRRGGGRFLQYPRPGNALRHCFAPRHGFETLGGFVLAQLGKIPQWRREL